MKTIRRSAIVPYSAADMYRLVADVDAYPEFLPWCGAAAVLRQQDAEVEARIEIRKGPVHKSFTTRNQMERDRAIRIQLVEGPFRRLHGAWQFQPLSEHGCQVSLEMEFEFSSRLLRSVMGPIFSEIAATLVDAFCRRAAQVYGAP